MTKQTLTRWLALRKWQVLVLVLVALTWCFQWFPRGIELFYTEDIYRGWSRLQGYITRLTSISIGDLLYAGVVGWLLVTAITSIPKIWRHARSGLFWWTMLRTWLFRLLVLWLVFQWSWALNYHRAGSSYQLQLQPQPFDKAQLMRLADTLQVRVSLAATQLQPDDTAGWYQPHLLSEAVHQGYLQSMNSYDWLWKPTSPVKISLYSRIGGYAGFSGYFNPFTGESQLVSDIPPYQRPYVMCHEIAHQQGFAAEQEANLVGYLVARQHPLAGFRYSTYHDMLTYTLGELFQLDSAAARQRWQATPELVKRHSQQSRAYRQAHQHGGLRYIHAAYDAYLRWNNQEKGVESYSYVTAWLVAYAERYGWEKL